MPTTTAGTEVEDSRGVLRAGALAVRAPHWMLWFFVAGLALVTISGCTEDVGSSVNAITGGFEDNGTPPLYPAVVLVKFPAEEGLGVCSGTLISPTHVLTAAHCTTRWARPGLNDPTRGPFQVSFGYHPLNADPDDADPDLERDGSVDVSDCVVHSEWRTDGECGHPEPASCADATAAAHTIHDVAVLRLARPVPPSWSTSTFYLDTALRRDFHRLPQVGETPPIGTGTAQVGYGMLEPRSTGNTTTVGYRRYRHNSLQALELGETPLISVTVGGTSGGDSGGPVIWRDAPGPGSGYQWEAPPIGVASCAPEEAGGTLWNASLVEATNLEFVRSAVDANGDGRFDYGGPGTSIPGSWGCPDRGFEGLSTPDSDRDGDGYLNGEDDAPDVYDPCQVDIDRDGVGDVVDNCDVWNPDQANNDPDALGDACDNCPFHFNPNQEDTDGDPGLFIFADGVGDACDNCPSLLNSLQENCNADAERVAGVEPMGDACDPNPCPNFRPSNQMAPSGPVTFEAWSSGLSGRPLALEESQGTLRTGFRFCPCDTSEDSVEARLQCRLTARCELAPSEYESGGVWRIPSVSYAHEVDVGDGTQGVEAVLRHAPPGGDARSFWADWRFEDDALAWGILEEVGPFVRRARGVVWSHALAYEERQVPRQCASVPTPGGMCATTTLTCTWGETTWGCPAGMWVDLRGAGGLMPDPNPFGCPVVGSCADAERTFSSHYWSGVVERLGNLRRPDPIGVLPIFFADYIGRICPVCRSGIPAPVLTRGCEVGDLCIRFGSGAAHFGDSDVPSPLEGAIDDIVADTLEPAVLAELLGSDLTWITASEPVGALDATAALFVGIDRSSGQTRVVARQLDGQVINSLLQSRPAMMGSEGSAYLLDGRSSTLFLMGEGDLLLAEHLASGIASEVALSDTLGRVEAAAILPGRHAAIVVDLAPGDSDERLLAVDLRDGQVTTLAAFPATGRSHALAAMPDGRVALAGWFEDGESVNLVTFRVEQGGLIEETVGEIAERPTGAFHANELGLTYLVADAESEWRPSGVAYDDLGAAEPGSIASAF